MESDYSIERPRMAKLTGPNYRIWSIQVRRYLEAQDLWDIVESPPKWILSPETKGTTENPASIPDAAAAKLEESKLRKQDAKASTAIMNACGADPLFLISELATAHEQWAKLKWKYAPVGLRQLGEKLRAFYMSTAPDGSSISHIAADLDRLQGEIGDISPVQRPTMEAKAAVLINIVSQKGGRYDNILAQVESEDIINYDKVVALFTNFERKILASKTHKEMALRAEASSYGGRTGGRKGKGGSGREQGKFFNGECHYCKKPGHMKADCRARKEREGQNGEKRGQPSTGPLAAPGGGKGLSPQLQEARLVVEKAWIAAVTDDEADERSQNSSLAYRLQELTWIVDSGATTHMTHSRKAFINYYPLDMPTQVRVANGEYINAIAKGTVGIKTQLKGSEHQIRINDVLHVPELAGNLISMGQLHEKGIIPTFVGNDKMLLKRDHQTIGVANRIGRSYVLSGTEVNDAAANRATAMTPEQTASLWHRRFGHLSSKSLRKAHTAVDDMPELPQNITMLCESCRLNKSTKVINRHAPERATQPLERIHSDVWGPYRVPAIDGGIYFITFTDDYTRKSWVYIASSKDQIRTIFTQFRVHVELETGRKVMVLRCDNGGEYKGLERIFGINLGIRFEYTTPYTQWQNGVSERLNRSLVSVGRAMLHDAGLPPELWGEAIMAASYLRNRTPIGPNGMTPEEAYSGKKPSVAHLRAWGCIAYAHLAPEQRGGDKLAQNAIRTALVGYTPSTKQYRLYDPERNKIILSTSLRFDEGRHLQFPGYTPARTEIVGFDPTEADPLSGPALDLNAHDRASSPHLLEQEAGNDSAEGALRAPLELYDDDDAATMSEPESTIVVDTRRRRHGDAIEHDSENDAPASPALEPASPQGDHEEHSSTQALSHTLDVERDASSEDDGGPDQQLLQEEAAQGGSSQADEPLLRRSGRVRRPAH
jgi:hypothetical protein